MYSWDNAQVVLVGNKCDLEQDRAVTQERGQRLADQLGNISSLSLYLACSTLDVRFLSLFVCFFVSSCLFAWLVVMSCVFRRVLQIKTHSWEKIPVMLIGNKCDMDDERVVQSEDGGKLASELGTCILENQLALLLHHAFNAAFCQHRLTSVFSLFRLGLEFFETSAKENVNVKAVFER